MLTHQAHPYLAFVQSHGISKQFLSASTLLVLLSLATPIHAGETQASDGAATDRFGVSVSVSGSTSLVGSFHSDVGSNNNQGSAYTFRNLDTAYGTVYEDAKLLAQNGASDD